MNLSGWLIPNFSTKRIYSIIIGIRMYEEGNFLSNREGNNKISLLSWFKLEHILMKLMAMIAANTCLILPGVELILSQSKLFRLTVTDLLCYGEVLIL